ncbi:MAG: hypothetical protein HDS82_06780 [Bacteroidales bacterium]|nr:hypothetical protein [Bacteroidales bacterium]
MNRSHRPHPFCTAILLASGIAYGYAALPDIRPENAELEAAITAYENYEFETAGRHLAAAAKQRSKMSEEDTELLDATRRQLATAKEFLERVEKLTVIDSIAVDADSFFKAYRLPQSAGAILPPDSIPFAGHRQDATTVFANENRNFMMWAESDTTGYTRLTESILLTDGSWSRPVFAPEELSEGGDADFPFMMADGTTLYYASDGDGSIGGLDIFVATRDAVSGEYLQPRNVGMPYNSPADDYLLAIDEFNGIGWWATDRNHLEDKVTIYVFLVNDMRENYSPDDLEDDELIDYARIAAYRDTWEYPSSYEERDESDERGNSEEIAQRGKREDRIKEALAAIKALSNETTRQKREFTLHASGGKTYTLFSELPNDKSRQLMKAYLAVKEEHGQLLRQIDSKRREYHTGRSKSLGDEIGRLEKNETELADREKKALNEVYRSL